MSIFSQPKAPDPYATAAAQTGVNTASAETQQALNMVNQETPFGNLTYSQNGYQTGPNGTIIPQYQATQTLSPQEQQLWNTTLGTQQQLGTEASNLVPSLSSALSKSPQIDPSQTTSQLMNMWQKYNQPIFNQQKSNLDAQLASQGIFQGPDDSADPTGNIHGSAFSNAQNQLSRNQNDAMNSFFMQAEPAAFSQAAQQYTLPIDTLNQSLSTLLGEGSPGNVTQSLTQTPSVAIQPANLQGAIQNNFNNQTQQYGNNMSALGSLASAIGGWGAGKIGSDIRLKADVNFIGRNADGIGLYGFRYKTGKQRYIGVMAQDVMQKRPDAVYLREDGMYCVDYEALGMEMVKVGRAC